jgi:predicted  nucleic acid-binding Zn-ribbon protein
MKKYTTEEKIEIIKKLRSAEKLQKRAIDEFDFWKMAVDGFKDEIKKLREKINSFS